MTNDNLEKKCQKSITKIDHNVEEIKHILSHMVASRKYYYTCNGYDKNSEYY
ncbi:MAG: hypothetical protein ABII64_02360 [Elusimicrobiota bacterium]